MHVIVTIGDISPKIGHLIVPSPRIGYTHKHSVDIFHYSLAFSQYSLAFFHYSLDNSHYSLAFYHYSLAFSHYSLAFSHYSVDISQFLSHCTFKKATFITTNNLF